MQDIHFGSDMPKPGELLPAVEKTQN